MSCAQPPPWIALALHSCRGRIALFDGSARCIASALHNLGVNHPVTLHSRDGSLDIFGPFAGVDRVSRPTMLRWSVSGSVAGCFRARAFMACSTRDNDDCESGTTLFGIFTRKSLPR